MILAGVALGRFRMARALLWPPPGRVGGGRLQTLGGALLAGGFALAAFGSLLLLFAELQSRGLAVTAAAAALALALAGAVVGILLFDVHYALAALLLDSDLALLRRAPLRNRELLSLKLVDSLPRTGALMAIVAVPAFLAFALNYPLPGWAWVLMPLQLGALWAIPLGIGLAGALLLVRCAPPRRTREAIGLLSSLLFAAVWTLSFILLPRFAGELEADLPKRLSALVVPGHGLTALSPPHWSARALLAGHQGAPLEAARWTFLLVAGAALSLGLATAVAGRSLDETLARVAGSAAPPRRPPRVRRAFGGLSALLLRDVRLLTRDWTAVGEVLSTSLVWTLVPLLSAPLYDPDPGRLARMMLVSLAAGLGFEVGARVVPMEGAGLAWCRLSPVPALRWTLTKLGGGAMVAFPILLSTGVLLRVALPVAWSDWGEALLSGAAATALALAFGIWTGWTFGNALASNPRTLLTQTGRLVATGLLLGQLAMWILLLSLADRHREALPPGLHAWGPPLLAALLAAPALRLAVGRLRKFEWVH